MVISKYNSKGIVEFINFFKNFSGDSYNLLGRWCHKGVPNCNESVIDKKIDFALLDNNFCTKVTKVTKHKKLCINGFYEIPNNKLKSKTKCITKI